MKTDTERFFSLELKSKSDLKNVVLSNGSSDGVLVEGSIGELLHAVFVEGVLLEVAGERGILRVNLEPPELNRR